MFRQSICILFILFSHKFVIFIFGGLFLIKNLFPIVTSTHTHTS